MKHPALRVTARENYFKMHWFFALLLEILRKNWKNRFFFKNFNFVIFFASDVKTLFGFSTSINSINQLFLPARLYFRSSSIRKWIQIEIWTYRTSFTFWFKSLALPKCRRLHFSNFARHRITLRGEDETSCSTSHCKRKLF